MAIEKVIRTEYSDGQVVLSNLRNKKGIPVFKENDTYTATKVTTWYDGTPMDDSKADGKVYLRHKVSGEYYLVNLPNWGETFLEKDTMSDMRGLSVTEILLIKIGYYKGVKLNGYYAKGDTPSPIEYKLSTTSATDDGGSVIEVDGIKLEHNFEGRYTVEYFGIIGDGVTDNTSNYTNLFNSANSGSFVQFSPNKHYVGNIRRLESISIDLNGSTLSGATGSTEAIINIGKGLTTIRKNVTASYDYGARALSVDNTTDLNIGDLIVLKDSTLRPDDSLADINSEILKIRSINTLSNTIGVEDVVRSTAITSPYVIDKVNSIKGVYIYNGVLQDGYWGILVNGAEDVEVRNIKAKRITRSYIRFLRCYNALALNCEVSDAVNTDAGNGYGVHFEFSRNCVASNIQGRRLRHSIDLSASYNVDMSNITVNEDTSSAIVLAHNSFGGNIKLDNANITMVDAHYGVQFANQGGSTSGAVNYMDLIARDLTLTNIKYTRPIGNGTSNNAVILIGCSFSNLLIDGVSLMATNPSYTIPTESQNVIRLYGVPLGLSTIRNINANKIGNVIHSLINVSTGYNINNEYPLEISDVRVETCLNLVSLRFGKQVDISNITVKNLTGANLINVSTTDYGVNLQEINFKGVIDYPATKLLINTPSHYTKSYIGSTPKVKKNNDVVKNLSTSTIITEEDILSRTILKVQNTSGSVRDFPTSNGLPVPRFAGQTIRIVVNEGQPVDSTRNHLRLPTATANLNTPLAPILLESGKSYQLIANADKKWDVFEDSYSKGFQSNRAVSNKSIGSADNINLFLTQGSYVRFAGSGTTIPNSPVQLPFILDVIKSPVSNHISQIAYETTKSRIYYRSTSDSGVTWSAWITIGNDATTTTKGLVNQSAKVDDVASANATTDTESTATDVAGLVTDFNDLVSKYNSMVTLVNELKTQLNAKFSVDRTSGQQSTT